MSFDSWILESAVRFRVHITGAPIGIFRVGSSCGINVIGAFIATGLTVVANIVRVAVSITIRFIVGWKSGGSSAIAVGAGVFDTTILVLKHLGQIHHAGKDGRDSGIRGGSIDGGAIDRSWSDGGGVG